MATKNLSIELGRGKSKVICVALHPGKFQRNFMVGVLLINSSFQGLWTLIFLDHITKEWHQENCFRLNNLPGI